MTVPAALRPVLWLHIAAGTVALVGGLGAMAARKGSTRHRRLGLAYVGGMVLVVATALLITSVTQDLFLGTIGVFSGYMVFAGYRALGQKRPSRGDVATLLDYGGAGLMLLVSLGMVGVGLQNALKTGTARAFVLIAFGLLGFVFAGQDALTFVRGPTLRFDWFYRHIARMLGGYIATVTAVSAVNLLFLPTIVRWLWPTVIGTPLIVVWIRRYQRKFENGKQPSDIAARLEHGTVNSDE